jgi:hypothetical protein
VTDAASGAVLARNTQFLAVPGRLNASRAVRVFFEVGAEAADGSIPVTLTASLPAPALFVTLFTLANGRFTDNFVPLLSGAGAPLQLRFLPFAPGQRDALAASLRVNTLGELLNPPQPPRPSKGTCTTHADTDGSGSGTTTPGNSVADCCAACWAEPTQQCTSAAYNPAAPGTCWLKFGGPSVPRAGILLCTLDGVADKGGAALPPGRGID